LGKGHSSFGRFLHHLTPLLRTMLNFGDKLGEVWLLQRIFRLMITLAASGSRLLLEYCERYASL
ncbi:hypothetical protein V5799_026181, partial [Amblyomma americanum]